MQVKQEPLGSGALGAVSARDLRRGVRAEGRRAAERVNASGGWGPLWAWRGAGRGGGVRLERRTPARGERARPVSAALRWLRGFDRCRESGAPWRSLKRQRPRAVDASERVRVWSNASSSSKTSSLWAVRRASSLTPAHTARPSRTTRASLDTPRAHMSLCTHTRAEPPPWSALSQARSPRQNAAPSEPLRGCGVVWFRMTLARRSQRSISAGTTGRAP